MVITVAGTIVMNGFSDLVNVGCEDIGGSGNLATCMTSIKIG